MLSLMYKENCIAYGVGGGACSFCSVAYEAEMAKCFDGRCIQLAGSPADLLHPHLLR